MTGEASAPERGLVNILFTSGSTGTPKGVEVTTRSLLHFSQWAVDFFELNENDRLANHAPFTFDLSTLDIFAAVRAGAAMCPVPERLKMFPYKLAELMAAAGITTWYSVPSALALLVQRGSLGAHDLSRLRHVIFAGEVMPKALLADIARSLPDASLTNLYGPTETNVCTFHRVSKEELATDDAVPIGRPISDTRAWIVDESGKVLAALTDIPERRAGIQIDEGAVASASGELWIAGPTVTTGYYGDAEQTAARRVDAPDGAGRAYRTGDRVTVRADGAMMFEGRMDRMIKRGGHRVEPGEIETVLGRHPSVGEAAVVPVADATFGSRLKACVAGRGGAALEESALVAYCRASLPSYMMPDLWEFHAALPRTDRGKVDLQKLMQ
jgi:acyl-coenzyme A synthetase/AMP-(fatty) acid ligase